MTSFTTPTTPSSFWEQLYTVSAPSHPAFRHPTPSEQAAHDDVVLPSKPVTLSYRGQSYQSSAYLMEGVGMNVKASYRGVSHELTTFCACLTSDRPQRTLYYRGVPYVQ
ncbi:MAG: DUF4278 domain-containing protein [Elainellaceae cyanobacterium]